MIDANLTEFEDFIEMIVKRCVLYLAVYTCPSCLPVVNVKLMTSQTDSKNVVL